MMEHNIKFSRIVGMKNRFHSVYLCHHQMSHFISNIHNYMVEVLESEWKVF